MKRTTLGLIAAIALAVNPALADEQELKGDFQFNSRKAISIADIGEEMAKTFGAKVFVEHSIREQKLLPAGEHALSYVELKAMLRRQHIEPIWSKAGGRWVLDLLSGRSPSRRVRFDGPVCTREDQLPRRNCMASIVYKIRHGDGRDIFQNLRALQAREPSRTGNLQWLRGPDTLIITGLTDKLRPLLAVLRALDGARPIVRARVVVLNLLPNDARALKLDEQLAAADKAALVKRLLADERVNVGLDAELNIASDGATALGRAAVTLTDQGQSLQVKSAGATSRVRLKKGLCELVIRKNPDARSNMVTCVFLTPLAFKNRD